MNEETQKDKPVLLDEIRKKAEAEGRGIIEEARKGADQKRKGAEAQALRIKEEALERAEARAESMRETQLANLAMQKKRIRLRRNEEIMQLVIGRVVSSLEERVDTPEYAEALEKWAVEACLGLGMDAAILETSPAERKYFDAPALQKIRQKVRDRGGPRIELSLSDKSTDGAGVVARSPDGRVVYDNRIRTRIRRNENTLKKIIYQELIQKGTI